MFDLTMWSHRAIESLRDTKKWIHLYGVGVHAKSTYLSLTQVTCAYFLFDPHNFGIWSRTTMDGSEGRRLLFNPLIPQGQCRNNVCLLVHDFYSLVAYSREELDQTEWDLLFLLTRHLSNNGKFMCFCLCFPDWTSQPLYVKVLKYHFLTSFAHI